MEYPLTKNQQQLFNAAEQTFNCYLFHGKPGCGKSVLANALRTDGEKPWFFAAPTGLAATNVMGRTLHSLFRIPVSDGVIAPDFNKFPTDFRVHAMVRQINHLFIDEVSMVRVDQFDYVDRFMRHAKGRPNEPFGGCQIIVCGDFYQLPPVVKDFDKPQLKEYGYESPFVFSSRVFQEHFKTLFLTEVLRQKGDPKFLDFLDSARDGSLHPKQMALLNQNIGHPGDIRMRLASKNAEADAINSAELSKLPGDLVTIVASSYGIWDEDPAAKVLSIKEGAQVMVKKNKADRPQGVDGKGVGGPSKVVNGTLGVITKINAPREGIEGAEYTIDLKLANGEDVTIYTQHWERKIKEKVDGEWTERVVAGFEQIPLALAWAITIHKSQGQTFDRLHIDARAVFNPGQAYVAVSRCRTAAGISLESPLTAKRFWADGQVVKFFEEVETE